MAATYLGDIPGARFHIASVSAHASVASNGAAARLDSLGPFDHNIRVRNVYWQPTAADHAMTSTASYRQLTLRNGGAAGTGTAIIGSLNLTATLASLGVRAFTMDSTATVASGAQIYLSHGTVGGDHANGSVLVAGRFALSYEVI